MPGFFSPTEAFSAIAAGAVHLKLFPARTATPDHLTAVREVLPPQVRLWAVGGVSAANMAAWLAKGAAGVGIGGSLYRAGTTPDELRTRARELMSAWSSCKRP
jgi:2-dehydro-3-deoxyphosphogalactonate aldolase